MPGGKIIYDDSAILLEVDTVIIYDDSAILL
jgi:hypothetical protein